MSKLIWHETDCCAGERGEWCAWIEPLDLEDEGRFVWSVDILDPSGGSVPFNVAGGIEPSLAAAKLAAEEAVAQLARTVTDYGMWPIE